MEQQRTRLIGSKSSFLWGKYTMGRKGLYGLNRVPQSYYHHMYTWWICKLKEASIAKSRIRHDKWAHSIIGTGLSHFFGYFLSWNLFKLLIKISILLSMSSSIKRKIDRTVKMHHKLVKMLIKKQCEWSLPWDKK